MATRVIDDTKLNDIAIAIQAKDSGGQMTVDEMPNRIDAFPTNQPLFSTNGTMYFEEMLIPDTVTTVKANAYHTCINMRKLEIAGTAKTISAYAFHNTYITELILNEGIKTFGDYAFCNHRCQTIALPSSTKTIGACGFSSSSIRNQIVDLSAFVDPNNLPTLNNSNAFANHMVLRYEVANQSMLDAFTTATNWSTYADRFQIKQRVNEITRAKDTIGGTALYNGTGYKQDYRWTSSNTESNDSVTGVPNKFAVGYIELEPGDVVHFYGDILKGTTGWLTMHIQSVNDTRLVRASLNNWADYTNRPDIMATMTDIDYDTTTNTLHSFKWTGGTSAVKGYMHLSCVGTFTEGVTVVTINEEM